MANKKSVALCALFAAIGASSCGASAVRASDMTPQEHCEAAAEERARAANAPRPSEGMQSGKATVDNRLRAERQMGADRHTRHAVEHEQAAAIAGGRSVPPCNW
jgi:hypothetical protein